MKKTVIVILSLCASVVYAQDSLRFNPIVQWDANPVESQGQTGTCCRYSTASFLVSELIRMGKGTHNLSEIFVKIFINII